MGAERDRGATEGRRRLVKMAGRLEEFRKEGRSVVLKAVEEDVCERGDIEAERGKGVKEGVVL